MGRGDLLCRNQNISIRHSDILNRGSPEWSRVYPYECLPSQQIFGAELRTCFSLSLPRKFKASSAGCAPSDVALIGHVDFNAPYAKNKSSLEGLCAALAMINEDLPQLACSMIVFPDHAREKSPRGLWDEERLILEEMFGLAQDCQTRFIDLYTRDDARAESKTNSRQSS